MAKRSAIECAAMLDVVRRLKRGPEPTLDTGRELLLRIVSMLTQASQVVRRRVEEIFGWLRPSAVCGGPDIASDSGPKCTASSPGLH